MSSLPISVAAAAERTIRLQRAATARRDVPRLQVCLVHRAQYLRYGCESLTEALLLSSWARAAGASSVRVIE